MPRTAGQRAGLTREQVVTAAADLLAADGIDAVSMRKVAERLGVAPNALYAHVPDKSALIDELVEAMLGAIADPDPQLPWRERAVAVLTDSRTALLAHPDLVPLLLVRQSTGPHALRLGEHLLQALTQAGLAGADAATAAQALLVWTVGCAAFETGRATDPDPQARQARGRQRTASAGGLSAAYAEELATFAGREVFERGLAALIDGFTAPAGPGSASGGSRHPAR
ncbi:MAG: TetR/AcrR family transcriptional regulator C-terminal domain-containing protein [Kineosporiaceae bacterium]